MLSAQPKRWQVTTRTASNNCPGRTPRPQQCSLLRTMVTVHRHPSSSNFWNRRPNGNQLLGNRKQMIHIFSATTTPQPTMCHSPTSHRVRSHGLRRINFGIILPERTTFYIRVVRGGLLALTISTMGEIFTGEGRKGNFPAPPIFSSSALPQSQCCICVIFFHRRNKAIVSSLSG